MMGQIDPCRVKKVGVEFVYYYEPEDEVQGEEYLLFIMALNIVYYY